METETDDMSKDDVPGTITSPSTGGPVSSPYVTSTDDSRRTTGPVVTRNEPTSSRRSRTVTPSARRETTAAPTGRPSAGLRLPFTQSNGKIIYVYDEDVSGVVSVTTDRHGACLILHLRDAGEIWIFDTPRHRLLLSMAGEDDLATLLGRNPAGGPR